MTTNKFPEFLTKIDFTMLRDQKATLLGLTNIKLLNYPLLSKRAIDDLDGILMIIDAIQDYACDEMGIPEMLVYDFEKEEEREKTLLGYQVIGNEFNGDFKNRLHPKITNSSCIYSKSQVLDIINSSLNYDIKPIYDDGEIINPIPMFNKNPND
jgi:hypothetical protein